MQREISLPVMIGAGVAVLALVAGLWHVYVAPRGGEIDPRLKEKARELRLREKTLAPPGH